MSDLRDLYQEVILDHSRSPRNFGFPAGCNRRAVGHNPLCGDRITVELLLKGDCIQSIGFEGSGCAISTAAASTMTEAVKGKTVAEAEQLFAEYLRLVTGKVDPLEIDLEFLDRLAAFGGVAEFPMRVKCATLAWHTLQAALTADAATVTTE
jgi:nitrogen fixation NifU-like protein